jgi:hypothetical protein
LSEFMDAYREQRAKPLSDEDIQKGARAILAGFATGFGAVVGVGLVFAAKSLLSSKR